MTVYTDADAIAAILGRTLTAAQITRATEAAEAASSFIEDALDRSWYDVDPTVGLLLTDERHVIDGCRIWLRHPPVIAVDDTLAVSVRMRYPNATTYALTQPFQYELIEPAFGHLYFSPTLEGQRAVVTYTTAETPPALIREFAGQLAAGMLALSLADSTMVAASAAGVKSYTLWGGDLRVEFANTASSSSGEQSSSLSSRLPALWSQIEALYSRKLVVA
jgi:hypothetical protein